MLYRTAKRMIGIGVETATHYGDKWGEYQIQRGRGGQHTYDWLGLTHLEGLQLAATLRCQE